MSLGKPGIETGVFERLVPKHFLVGMSLGKPGIETRLGLLRPRI